MTHRWYVIHVYSGFEKRVQQHLQERLEKAALQSCVTDILVPTRSVVEMKRGQKVNAEKQYFPGYVLIKMELTDAVWHLVRETPKVAGFVGVRGKPSPITEAEAERMLKNIEQGASMDMDGIQYEAGETVKVIEGPFASFTGLVESVDHEKGRLKVSVSIFGRPTPVELEYSQVEKVE